MTLTELVKVAIPVPHDEAIATAGTKFIVVVNGTEISVVVNEIEAAIGEMTTPGPTLTFIDAIEIDVAEVE